MASLGFHFSSVMSTCIKNKPFSLVNLSFVNVICMPQALYLRE